ncbi:MFS general substrate transporter [Linderina pennispora]|uniref:MFS general substrate transporter n=1 Tax=Linderina pennispora TaxID=61395 RepID=A0A1Y1W2V6_9FUNG|nr:MFS general substrate transporter [Linderina pennispora]ORX67883.1 MFS general substrate transporter [Linderina pennispora]
MSVAKEDLSTHTPSVVGSHSSKPSHDIESGPESDPVADEKQQLNETLIKGKQMVGVMVALALSMFLAALDNTIVATMLPKISAKFDALTSASWIVSSYMISSTALQPIYGKLCNIYGHRPVLLVSHVFFLVGSVICGASKSTNMLIAGRAIAGIGGSGLMSICFVVVGDIVPTAQNPMYLAVFGLVWAVASIAGPVLGGVFADKTGFEWGFYINPCIQAVVLVLIVLFMKLPIPHGSAREKLKRIDFLGIMVIVTGIVLLQLGLTWGGRDHPWKSAAVISPIIVGFMMLVVFVLVEWKIPPEPVMPLRLFRRRNVSLVFAVQVTFGMTFFLPIFYFPIYLSVVKNASAISSGLHLVSCMLAISLFSIISGIAITKTGRYLQFIWIGTAMAVVGIGLFVLLGDTPTQSKLIGIPIVFGAGLGLSMQSMITCAQNAVDQEDVATTTTLLMTIRMLGSAIGLAIAQSIFQNKLSPLLVKVVAKFPEAEKIIFGAISNQSIIWEQGVPADVRMAVIHAYVESLHMHIPLRKRIGGAVGAME